MPDSAWDNNVRVLHWVVAITVSFQQFTSLGMSDPGTQFLFPYHQIVGIIAALATLLVWLYSYATCDLGLLFPWNRAGLQAIRGDLRELTRARLPAHGHRVGLSSLIHGLGLLAVTGCALTGLVMFSMVPPGHVGPPDDPIAFTRYVLQHKFFGTLLWAYWIGHVAFALLHQIAGHGVFGNIFGFRKPAEDRGSRGTDPKELR